MLQYHYKLVEAFIMGGINMKTDINDLKKIANELVAKSKNLDLIRPCSEAFDDFPVTEEVDKGQKDAYKKIN